MSAAATRCDDDYPHRGSLRPPCCAASALLGGCQVQPWVKPYEREHLADPIMSFDRNPISSSYLDHVFEVREGARGRQRQRRRRLRLQLAADGAARPAPDDPCCAASSRARWLRRRSPSR